VITLKQLGSFEIESQDKRVSYSLDGLKQGINDLKDHILKLSIEGKIEFVVNKVCDHAGGRLIVKGNKAICPMHSWSLNLHTLEYDNSHVRKEKVSYDLSDDGIISINTPDRYLVNPFSSSRQKGCFKLRWINHATVHIECNGVSLITDPWLFGPAFMTGWWLPTPSPEDALDLLKSADLLYVSHNHPDHMHAETLSIINKDKLIITPNFKSGSSEKILKNMGFSNVRPLEFLEIFEVTEGFQLSILKSGDFRDDSGIYIYANGHESILTVDSNFLNAHVLPRNIDLLLTSFAGGASGFPLCFNDFSESEKEQIIKRNRNFEKTHVLGYLNVTQPKYYMPYAGMFVESAKRDEFIKQNNVKNKVNDFQNLLKNRYTEFLRPNNQVIMTFSKEGVLEDSFCECQYLEKEDTDLYINNLKTEYVYNEDRVIEYLTESGYVGKQILQIIPTDDSFQNQSGQIVFADFFKGEFKTILSDQIIKEKEGFRVMLLRIRPEALMCVISNFLPWEDFSIGFQMRVNRFPNQYESDFWYHFSNVYIAKENFRYSSYCGSCTVINQNPIWAS